jgi:hypothetical protein
MARRFIPISGGWLTTLLLLPSLLVSVPMGAVWTLQRQSQERRNASLIQYPHRLVLPADIPTVRLDELTTQIQSWLAPKSGDLPDPAATVEVLTGSELARRLPLQEAWITDNLGSTPIPNPLPNIISVTSPASLIDPVRSADLTDRLRTLHPKGFVAHEQLELDALLAAQSAEREREARLALLVNAAGVLGILVSLLSALFSQHQRIHPDSLDPIPAPARRLPVLLVVALILAGLGWIFGVILLG